MSRAHPIILSPRDTPSRGECRAKALAPVVWPACWNCAAPVIGYDPEPGVDGDPCCSLRCALGDWLADQNGLPPAFNAYQPRPLIKEGK